MKDLADEGVAEAVVMEALSAYLSWAEFFLVNNPVVEGREEKTLAPLVPAVAYTAPRHL